MAQSQDGSPTISFSIPITYRFATTNPLAAPCPLVAKLRRAEEPARPVQRQMMAHKFAVSSVRCWPHHFDLSTLTTLPVRAAETTGHVGVGLSPGDEYYNEPYFYISVYPDPDSAMLPGLPKFGHWHTHEFTAAVMPARRPLSAA